MNEPRTFSWSEINAPEIFKPNWADQLGGYGIYEGLMESIYAKIRLELFPDHCTALVQIGPRGQYRGVIWRDHDGLTTNKGEPIVTDATQLPALAKLSSLGREGQWCAENTLSMLYNVPLLEKFDEEKHARNWPKNLI